MKINLNRAKEVKHMPGYDQTGPRGDGPMSGVAQGMCGAARFDRRQEQRGGFGQGRGRRQGRGYRCGMGNRFGRRTFIPFGPQLSDEQMDEE